MFIKLSHDDQNEEVDHDILNENNINNKQIRVDPSHSHAVIHDQVPVFPCGHPEHQQITITKVPEVDLVFVQHIACLDVFEEEGEEDGQDEVE